MARPGDGEDCGAPSATRKDLVMVTGLTNDHEPRTDAERAAKELLRALMAAGMDPIDALAETIRVHGREAMAHFLSTVREDIRARLRSRLR